MWHTYQEGRCGRCIRRGLTTGCMSAVSPACPQFPPSSLAPPSSQIYISDPLLRQDGWGGIPAGGAGTFSMRLSITSGGWGS